MRADSARRARRTRHTRPEVRRLRTRTAHREALRRSTRIRCPPARAASQRGPLRMPAGRALVSRRVRRALRHAPARVPAACIQRSMAPSSRNPSRSYSGSPMSVASSLIQCHLARAQSTRARVPSSCRANPRPRYSCSVSTIPIHASSCPKQTAVVVARKVTVIVDAEATVRRERQHVAPVGLGLVPPRGVLQSHRRPGCRRGQQANLGAEHGSLISQARQFLPPLRLQISGNHVARLRKRFRQSLAVCRDATKIANIGHPQSLLRVPSRSALNQLPLESC